MARKYSVIYWIILGIVVAAFCVFWANQINQTNKVLISLGKEEIVTPLRMKKQGAENKIEEEIIKEGVKKEEIEKPSYLEAGQSFNICDGWIITVGLPGRDYVTEQFEHPPGTVKAYSIPVKIENKSQSMKTVECAEKATFTLSDEKGNRYELEGLCGDLSGPCLYKNLKLADFESKLSYMTPGAFVEGVGLRFYTNKEFKDLYLRLQSESGDISWHLKFSAK